MISSRPHTAQGEVEDDARTFIRRQELGTVGQPLAEEPVLRSGSRIWEGGRSSAEPARRRSLERSRVSAGPLMLQLSRDSGKWSSINVI
jgi:hypothetical protein